MCKFECTVLAYCFCTLSTFVYLGILRGPAAAPLPIIWRKDAKYGNGLIFYRITSISEENTNSLPPPPPRPACTVTCQNLRNLYCTLKASLTFKLRTQDSMYINNLFKEKSKKGLF
jgi:hypothetical protein